MIRVLLISPTDPDKPGNLKFLVGGENTYTQILLNSPPRGVIYTYHMDALKRGLISYLPLHYMLKNLVKFRILPLSAGTEAIKINADFDLVHCHGYSVKIVGKSPPIVVSDSSSNYLFLRDYAKWPKWRIRIGYWIRRQLFGWLGVIDCDTNWQRAKKIVVFSKFAEKIHRGLGIPSKELEVVYPGLFATPALCHSGDRAKRGRPESLQVDSGPFGNTQGKQARMTGKDINILFVGIWFERKGGPLLLEAYRRLSEKYDNLKLTVVGPVPKKFKVQSSKFKVYDYLPREKLMREIFPKADIFVLVPPVAEGLGFAVLEAMSFGIPSVVSRVYALPELIEDGKSGFVIDPGNEDQLVKKLEILITNRGRRQAMGEAARKKFELKFSAGVLQKKLRDIYEKAAG